MKSAAIRLLFWFALLVCCQTTEVKWTPAEPQVPEYSVQERQQLLQLDQQISSSPDPQATLQQVASSNGISADELVQVLMENRQFFEQHGGGISSSSSRTPLAGKIVNTLTATMLLVWRLSLKHPHVALPVLMALFLSVYLSWNAPRNGILFLGRRGPSTIFAPPMPFLEATMLQPEWWELKQNADSVGGISSSRLSKESADVWRLLELAEKRRNKKKDKKGAEEILWHSDFSEPKAKNNPLLLSKAATIERTVDLEEIYTSQRDSNDDDESDEYQEVVLALAQEQSERLLVTSPQLTEFDLEQSVRFFTSQEEEGDSAFGVLLVRKLGSWGTIGYIPFAIQSTTENVDKDSSDTVLASTVLRILPGTHWEGQEIHIRVMQQTRTAAEPTVVVQAAIVTKATPSKKASKRNVHQLPKRLTSRILESICTSLQMSLAARTKQAWVRQAQSARFSNRAKRSAKERRETRAARERHIEEMASDRRRRRFSQNQNQGRYRPSGERMHSPNNAVYK